MTFTQGVNVLPIIALTNYSFWNMVGWWKGFLFFYWSSRELQKSDAVHFLNHQRFLLGRYCMKWSVKWVHLTFLQWIMHIIGTPCISHQFTLTCTHATARQASSQKSDSLDKSHTAASLVSFAEVGLNRSSTLTSHFSLPFIRRYISHLKCACQAHSLSCFERIMGKQINWSKMKKKNQKQLKTLAFICCQS